MTESQEQSMPPMEFRILGKTDLKVSRVALGTMTFGGQTPEAEAVRMVDSCLAGMESIGAGPGSSTGRPPPSAPWGSRRSWPSTTPSGCPACSPRRCTVFVRSQPMPPGTPPRHRRWASRPPPAPAGGGGRRRRRQVFHHGHLGRGGLPRRQGALRNCRRCPDLTLPLNDDTFI